MINKRVTITIEVYPETKEWLEELKAINPDATWNMIFEALRNRVPLSPKPQCKSTTKQYILKQQVIYPSNTAVKYPLRATIEDVVEALNK